MKYQGKRDASHCQINNRQLSRKQTFTICTIRYPFDILNRHTVLKMQSFSDKDSTFALDLFKSLHSRNIILTTKNK